MADKNVYYLNTDSWADENVKCHHWGTGDGAAPGTAWSGDVMNIIGKFGNYNLFVLAVDDTHNKCIFNNNGSDQKDEANITTGHYYNNGTWTELGYYICHNWNGGQTSIQNLVDNKDGTYSFVGILGNSNVKIITEDGDLYTISFASLTNPNGYTTGDWCTFTWTSASPSAITLSAPTGTFHTVDIYHVGARNLYAFNNNIDFNGGWPGKASTGENKTYINGAAGGHFTIKVLDGQALSIIFSDNGDSQTADISLGTISSNKTYYYATSGSTLDATNLHVAGSFNSWNTSDNPFYNGVAIIPLTGDATFKIIDGSNWRTNTTAFTESGQNRPFTTIGGSGNDASIEITSAGDYVLAWMDPLDYSLTVYFPGGTYTRTGMSADKWGTICVPYTVTSANRSGATIYSIVGKDKASSPESLYLEPIGSKDMVAGQPYFFKATGTDNLSLTFSGSAAHATVNNGLVGSFKKMTVAADMYLLSNGSIVKAGSGCSITGCKAFIDMDMVPVSSGSGAPGIIRLDLGENGATNIEAIDASEEAVKFFQNGKLFIQKNGVVYDMMGSVVK